MLRFLLQFLIIVTFALNISQVSAKERSDEEMREDFRKIQEEKKKDLNGTSWNVEIKPQSGKGALEGADELVFQNGRFTSKKMTKKGAASSDRRLRSIRSSFAVTLKVGLRGFSITEMTAGKRWIVCTYS